MESKHFSPRDTRAKAKRFIKEVQNNRSFPVKVGFFMHSVEQRWSSTWGFLAWLPLPRDPGDGLSRSSLGVNKSHSLLTKRFSLAWVTNFIKPQLLIHHKHAQSSHGVRSQKEKRVKEVFAFSLLAWPFFNLAVAVNLASAKPAKYESKGPGKWLTLPHRGKAAHTKGPGEREDKNLKDARPECWLKANSRP